ncbi:MAG: HAMP domain-containing sensor histidine kinase [Deltaproteobacteria bacterium]|nr:HAMP domain-containing sensor histidine kinase [Deltaproteobacteria bacterium]
MQLVRRSLRRRDTMTLRGTAIFASVLVPLLALCAYSYHWDRASAAKYLFQQNVRRIVALVETLERGEAKRSEERLMGAIGGVALPVQSFREKPLFLTDARCYALAKDNNCNRRQAKRGSGEGTEVKDFGVVSLSSALRERGLVGNGEVTAVYFRDNENPPQDTHYRTNFGGSEQFDPMPSRRKAIMAVEYRSKSGRYFRYTAFVTATDTISPGWAWRMAGWLLAVATGGILLSGVATYLATGSIRRLSLDDPASAVGPRETRRIASALKASQEDMRSVARDLGWALAALTHDMRTTLVRLKLFIEDISDDSKRDRAEGDLAQLESMLHEAYEVARSSSNDEPQQQVDLASLVQALCDAASDAGRTARYRGPGRIVLNCQSSAIRRALANLINNAIDYGDEADVELSEDDETVRIVIGDRGPGIPAAEREAAFVAYKRLPTARDRNPRGEGLGLPIARNAIRRCGGDIFLRDREGGGLEVLVTLPKR